MTTNFDPSEPGQRPDARKPDSATKSGRASRGISDAVFRKIIDASLDALITIDETGRVIHWNRRAVEMFGWSREEAVDHTLLELIIPPRDAERHREGLIRYQNGGPGAVVNRRVELTALHRDGHEFPVELSVTPVEIDGQTIFSGSMRDLTQEIASEQQISRHTMESRLLQQASILSATSDSFEEVLKTCVTNLGEIMGWPVGHVFFTKPPKELISSQIWYGGQQPHFVEFVKATEELTLHKGRGLPGRVWEAETSLWIDDVNTDEAFIRRDRGLAGIQTAFAFPVRAGNEVVAVVEFFHNEHRDPDTALMELTRSVGDSIGRVIERERAQKERSRLAAIVDASADAIITKDCDGTMTSWNAAAQQMYGWSAKDAIGKSIVMLLPAGKVEEEPELRDVLEKGMRIVQYETRRRTKRGQIIDVSITAFPIRDHKQRIVGISHIERDITVRRKRDEELRVAQQVAAEADRTRGEFLANVSHELRTPMNAILGMTSLALQETSDDEVADYLTTVKESADSMLMLVNDILDFSRLEAGRFELDPVPFRIRSILDDVMRMLSLRAHESSLELACEIDKRIPTHLIGDPVRLRQIVANLVSNAIKFTEKGEVLVNVRIVSTKSAEREYQPGDEIVLEFSVADTGVGIDAKDRNRIFAPFMQADASTTRKYAGTGLGLAICQELTELMGGRIWLTSELGQGSTFYFTARLQVGERNVEEDRWEQMSVGTIQGMRVLVVDDNQANRRIMHDMLRNWSLQPTVVSSAMDALRELERNSDQYPLVIVDALMPDTDGFTLINEAKIRGYLDCATILMLSSADRLVFKERCEGLPISTYLEKPISQSLLLDSIMTALKGPMLKSGEMERIRKTGRTLNVLVAEDTRANQKLISTILRKRGHSSTLANNGREVLEKLRKGTYDVVLMDVQMPVMDGLTATKAIRKLEGGTGQHIPIVAMTAHAMRGDREICLSAGMDSYVSKPIDANELLDLTESLCWEMKQDVSEFFETGKREETGAKMKDAPTPVPQPKNGTIDLSKTLERTGNDIAMVRTLVMYFLEDAPECLENIQKAIAAGDAEEASRAAHSLKGLCSTFDADDAVATALTVEKEAAAGNFEEVSALLPKLRELIHQLNKDLQHWQAQFNTQTWDIRDD